MLRLRNTKGPFEIILLSTAQCTCIPRAPMCHSTAYNLKDFERPCICITACYFDNNLCSNYAYQFSNFFMNKLGLTVSTFPLNVMVFKEYSKHVNACFL